MTTSPLEMDVQQEIWQLIQDLNEAWIKGCPEKLNDFFHENMIIVSPDFQELGRSRQSCIKGYEDFCNQATVHHYEEINPRIDVHGNIARATYYFELSYEMNSKIFNDKGWDVFVFVNERERWWATWRTFISSL